MGRVHEPHHQQHMCVCDWESYYMITIGTHLTTLRLSSATHRGAMSRRIIMYGLRYDCVGPHDAA